MNTGTKCPEPEVLTSPSLQPCANTTAVPESKTLYLVTDYKSLTFSLEINTFKTPSQPRVVVGIM
jgi:hypothetical protein